MFDDFEAIAHAWHRISQVGVLGAISSFLTSSGGGVVIGIVIGLAGFAVQWYYRREANKRAIEADKRAIALQELKMKLLQDGYEARAALHEESRSG